ncbi:MULTISPECIES: acyl-CoA dehydrogenase family protein [Streptomyces]|uniref:Acyl-CoA/acyl-ACP dehydrogenase n=1 Tax=Streptomyces caniscabiei TaxID=2746961 RepID=A0ABU4MG09_9ACTN|nr:MULTISPECIES: acyl-CoA dehydrogenase family protein [Streptomyces]MBE4734808.1 acyl-CoA/acyl-ACP dehydrogenase [Streptomyces caniscabiei]MBE4753942.1 acyl-CoA/acyl-ACP dehydrogenase [Streptomyces caniscabiei]MBE4783993.1 acyl-CoA/acyl-ACP dehydrogenase [Streptomyces caniscabiei]MBE4791508.1 acyl-CoA/acyl-ACP dehydrogenase [Streptomyces caniscabiei]MDX2943164.1 acyl-CoA/acyl-ACP dehydrogenase [Streptomyces caniscabiei]
MDFTFTEEQQAAAEAARAVFAGVAPDGVPSPSLVPGAVADDFDRALWAKLADADLLSLLLDPAYGGSGLDPIALCLVLRESAKVLARVPLLESSAAAVAVQAHGNEELKAELLARVGRGEVVLTVAAHGRTGHDPAELAVTARRDAGGVWILDGVQTAVPWAHNADYIVIPATVAPESVNTSDAPYGAERNAVAATDGGTVLALVPCLHEGVTLAEQISTAGERLAELRLDAVRIADRDVLDAEGAWERLRELLATGTCALALGLGEQVLGMTGDYAGKREQFGFPIASFQAVAVQAADRFIDLRAMEATLWQAAWRITSGAGGALPVSGDVAVAKIWASEGVRRVVQTAQHLHGGFGADVDYPLHRYHAWAKHLELSLGPAAAHEEALGDLLAAHPLG